MPVSPAARTQQSRRERELTAQKRVLELMADGRPLPAVLVEVCHLVDGLIESAVTAVLLFDERTVRLHHLAGPALAHDFRTALANLHPDQENGAVTGQSFADRLRCDIGRLAEAAGSPLWASEPIRDADSNCVHGLVVAFRSRGRRPTDEELLTLREAAELAGHALRRLALPDHQPDGVVSAPQPMPPDGAHQHLVDSLPVVAYVQRVAGAVTTEYLSPRIEDILGWTPDEYAAHPAHWFAMVQPADQPRVRAAVAHALATGEPLDVVYRVLARSGQQVWLRDMATLSRASGAVEQRWNGVLIDVTAEKAVETRLHSMAYYDSLTGLPNRRLVMDRLRSLLGRTDPSRTCLLFLDLDGFKFINDGIGHAAGDELLIAVARRLSTQVAGHGSLARFGGDEFVVILDADREEQVTAVAEALLGALRSPFFIDGYELNVDGTIGIATTTPELSTPEALLRAADRALYRAKASGRGVYAVYDERIDRRGPDEREQEAALRRAMDAGEFGIAYQPVVDIETNQIVAVEALLRWNHPERGTLRPSEFLPLADEIGLIVPLGRWVIEEACRQMKEWQDQYAICRTLQVSVNLAGRQYRQPTLAVDIALALRKTGLSPSSLALEVKEADALAVSAVTAETVEELNRMGVTVTIDDFGSGWSILDSLSRLAVDDLKLAGSCVSRLGEEQQDDVVRALVNMANAVGKNVTAGGVENGDQLARLRALGCRRAQGHHLAPPLTVAEMELTFKRHDAAPRQAPANGRRTIAPALS